MTYRAAKRAFDFVFAVLMLLALFPVIIIMALWIKIDTKGPVLFKQQRVGKNLKIFTIYKFCTMSNEKNANGKLLPDSQRMTGSGKIIRKLSLDELPQLLNIIKGEMSFIGPRPLLIEYIPRYSQHQNRRHEITPGITGWAQVNGRNLLSWSQKFDMDVWYVDNISLKTDIKIIFLTFKAVFNRRGVNSSETQTMPYFMGNEGDESE